MACMAKTYGQCIVCGETLVEKFQYGRRLYCPKHLAAFYQDITPIWQASTLTFLLVLALIAGVAISSAILHDDLPHTQQIAGGLVVTLAPGLVWIVLLLRARNRQHEQISSLMLAIFVLAALIAAAVIRPFLDNLVNLNAWLARATPGHRFLSNILIGGMTHAFALYVVIRYTVWRTSSFVHRVDGVLYGLAAGFGYSAAINALMVLDLGGLAMLNGYLRLISQMAAYLATSLVVGYFLGRNRFEDMPFYYLASGVALAGALNGGLLYAGSALDRVRLGLTSDGYSPWPGLVISLFALIVTYSAVFGLLHRHNALTKARVEHEK